MSIFGFKSYKQSKSITQNKTIQIAQNHAKKTPAIVSI